MRILLLANYADGVGGIAVQVKLLHEKLISEGFQCDILSTKGFILQRIKTIFRLLCIGKKYDVFHIHACSNRGFFPAIVGITLGRLLRRRIVLTFHGGGAEEFFKKRTRLVKWFLNRTNHNIVLSGFIGKVYDKYGIQYTVIPNIIELKENRFTQKTCIRPILISTRSHTETYNIECTLKAFGIIKKRMNGAQLLLLGDGPLKGQMERYVTENHIDGVSFIGQVVNDRIYEFLNQADIMISSSWFDNMPVSILEGFNAGLLVIASNVGGIPFMIKNHENGLLFNPSIPEELAENVIWAINHQQGSLNMIKNARESLELYSWSSIKQLLIPLYSN